MGEPTDIVKEETPLTSAEELESEKAREVGKWENYTPSADRRPPDEFFELAPILELPAEDITGNGGVMKYVVEEGKGSTVQSTDTVYYKHETRYSNGQLVDFSEKRKASEKFEMNDPMYHDYYKIAMRTMKKGEVCWVKFSQQYHGGTYFKT